MVHYVPCEKLRAKAVFFANAVHIPYIHPLILQDRFAQSIIPLQIHLVWKK